MPVVDTATKNPTQTGPQLPVYTHPIYDFFRETWVKLKDVREGIGGFLDGTYLVAHPREWADFNADSPRVPTKKLKARRTIASYDNLAEAIISGKKSALFRERPTRRLEGVENAGEATGTILDWWEGEPGYDDIDAQLAQYWDVAATFGHVFLYLERPRPGEGEEPYICAYSPLDTPDWIFNKDGSLRVVRFLEPVERMSIETPVNASGYNVRTIDEVEWILSDQSGNVIERAPHGMGKCPVVILYALKRPLLPGIGKSPLGDPKVHIDCYNLQSELRELLRLQTFSILNVVLGTGPDAIDVQKAKELLGTETGAENVLFSAAASDYISAETGNVAAYQQELDRRYRTIYRTAAIAWEADAKGVEAEGSLSLKREDMNQRLSSYADELERVEYALADLWYRAKYGEQGPARYEADDPTISWPNNFDLTPFENILKQAQAKSALGYPIEFKREMLKELLPKMLPGASKDAILAIEEAIDKMEEPEMPTLGLVPAPKRQPPNRQVMRA